MSVCHVLRYTPFWTNIKQLIDQDKIGDIISIQLNENVEIMHMSHSFVRGNWNNDKTSSPMILAKSCHDMDIINYILQSEVERISSFGNLMYFKENYKPEGAPIRCLEGCPYEQTCIFHAGNYYLGKGRGWARKFTDIDTDEAIIEKLNTTDYGKCVFQSDNNVVDHQVVNMQCENGATVTFSMCGFTREQTRIVQIMGTKGEIRGNMDENKISTYTYLNEQEEVILLPEAYGHGGGDSGIIRDFLHTIDSNTESKSSAEKSMKSHMMAFAAEASRKRGGEPIVLSNFISNLA
ncbi:Gfo/Idh/MocA family oxidoreductase [Macrococcus armenti]|uniref:Gfo/Idh/MocA family oxidoreductase n=1 Tax=Macrococcus armenti TaxID=2875764 RepID=UPI00311AAAD1